MWNCERDGAREGSESGHYTFEFVVSYVTLEGLTLCFFMCARKIECFLKQHAVEIIMFFTYMIEIPGAV